jgi:hypothetical protein
MVADLGIGSLISWLSGALTWLALAALWVLKWFFEWIWDNVIKPIATYIWSFMPLHSLANNLHWPDTSAVTPYLTAANMWIPIQETWDLFVVYVSLWLLLVGIRLALKMASLFTTGGW